jgi:hypothetical protein
MPQRASILPHQIDHIIAQQARIAGSIGDRLHTGVVVSCCILLYGR